jgi:hypothetical protein
MASHDLRFPFVKKYRDRHGKLRFYHRPTGTALPGLPGSREFLIAYRQACAQQASPSRNLPIVQTRRRTDAEVTIDWLTTRYLGSVAFKHPSQGGLALETQAGRRRALERFRADYGDLDLHAMTA